VARPVAQRAQTDVTVAGRGRSGGR
jgi:hypothetical protein